MPQPWIHLHVRGSEDERERSGMVDSRAETSSLSDKTGFTETEDQGAMHQKGHTNTFTYGQFWDS